jgi:HlyD family secretion protein
MAQIEKYEVYKKGLNEQFEITLEEHNINRRQFQRDSLLFKQNLIPEVDYEKSKKTFLQSNFELKSANNLITATQIRINELEQNILDLEIDFAQQRHNFENELKSQYDILLSQFKQFEYKYVLKSPIDGNIAFNKYWSTNQNVTTGELIFTVVPSDPKNLIGKVNLPIQRSGEVKAGLNVIIKLDGYPYKEYGAIKGIVKSVSLVPSDNSYVTEISLNNGLTTNYGRKLDFTQEMKGTAEIVTKEMRLIERLIQPIRYILKRNLY